MCHIVAIFLSVNLFVWLYFCQFASFLIVNYFALMYSLSLFMELVYLSRDSSALPFWHIVALLAGGSVARFLWHFPETWYSMNNESWPKSRIFHLWRFNILCVQEVVTLECRLHIEHYLLHLDSVPKSNEFKGNFF